MNFLTNLYAPQASPPIKPRLPIVPAAEADGVFCVASPFTSGLCCGLGDNEGDGLIEGDGLGVGNGVGIGEGDMVGAEVGNNCMLRRTGLLTGVSITHWPPSNL